uniref:Uncharacterized protein n=1 Tax=Hemiselmis andersenii TaxID=464988 RepID=A0A6U2HW27_HEMAN|mmetsp:Transcript_42473/g.98845  ORF Transcript_42473/g.98845 Transcript_42473/m.98845 type:complete len:440 (-) Transcript_42473:338-1657(-)|eukprot:CAMPEP_0114124296 /NCGR_PEP_ID=MMETSP0043_2-20121206/8705_1 /TAXON_ID=464988 /ORGANISM="Hemiselmis andersenii, Strain CCMP644" /LENGTH=439 /DNA_ID=CAMNT_0001217173 /DNA_START=49 /DNA_END=1368 /DNA_ORIENTATION=-
MAAAGGESPPSSPDSDDMIVTRDMINEMMGKAFSYPVWNPGDLTSEEIADRAKDGTINTSAQVTPASYHPTHGLTPLVRAMRKGETLVEEVLAVPECDPNARNQDGNTALTCAAEHFPEFFENLCRHPKINPNLTDNEGWSALQICVKFQPEHVASLIEAGKKAALPLNVELGSTSDGITPLIWAIANTDVSIDTVEALLKGGANPNNKRSTDGLTPLLAAITMKVDCIPLLFKYGVQPEAPDLEKALLSGHADTAIPKLFESEGFDPGIAVTVNITPNEGTTFLMAVIHLYPKLAEKLVKEDGRLSAECVNKGSKEGITPLMLAAIGGRMSVMKALCALGANVNSAMCGGANDTMSLLHLAAKEFPAQAVSALLDLKSTSGPWDLELRMAGGRTPLHVAAAAGQKETLQVLLKAGADAAATDADGKTYEQLFPTTVGE